MKQIYQVFPKEAIGKLPRLLFDGPIEVIDTEEGMLRALDELREERLLGIDTETRPAFSKGKNYHVGLLQVATKRKAYLFRLNKIGLTKELAALLESNQVEKVGLSLGDDTLQLRRRMPRLSPCRLTDLQAVAKSFGIDDMSLKKLCANILGRNLSKRQQLSNWNAPQLTEAQQRYAATDAWVCLLLLEEFKKLQNTSYHFIKHIYDNDQDTTTDTQARS